MKLFLITFFCVCLAVTSVRIPSSHAAFGSDTDKPAPVFSRSEASVMATLIPRGKNTQIDVRFDVSPGILENVEGMDFEAAKDDSVDVKDFRCALFAIKASGFPPGSETRVSIRSQFFTGSTRYWVYNKHLSQVWRDAEADSISLPDREVELRVRVKDGGVSDSDGLANGSILLVGGPLDSFWGYALGTLFIRFFGIFLVLTILMLGMLGSSRIFQFIEGRKTKKQPQPLLVESEPLTKLISPEMAAAICMALHIHLGKHGHPPKLLLDPESASWVSQGRVFAMDGRFGMYDRTRHIHK
jgi:hypothetical protein